MTILEVHQGSRVVRLKLDEIACLLKSNEGDLEIRLHGGFGFRIDNPEEIKALWNRWRPDAP